MFRSDNEVRRKIGHAAETKTILDVFFLGKSQKQDSDGQINNH